MLRAGLTGGIASGKSLVAKLFARQGAHVIDADAVTHRLYRKGQPGSERIARAFGSEVVLPDGSIDRRRLGAVVFSDPEKRVLLNSIVHPVIMQQIDDELKRYASVSPAGIAVVELPLLVEGGYSDLFDVVVLVYAPPPVQKARLVARNEMSEQEAEKRLASQMSIDEKRASADYIIENTRDVESAERQVARLYASLLRKAALGLKK